jgi:transcription elongation factor Elf1
MLKNKQILENLQSTNCPKCGTSLSTARIDTVFEAQSSFVAHAVCSSCSTSSMVTVTPNGSGTVPIYSDLSGTEFKKFLTKPGISYEDVLDLHLLLKKENIWNLLHKKEK